MNDIALERFTGFAALYNDVRPRPPQKLCEIILSVLDREKLDTLIDLGCGSGLSTRIWKPYARNIIGIEPNDDMRKVAEKANPELSFIKGNSYQTGIESASADVVCCSQSFHWMEPESTLKEVNRLLTERGVFAVLDCEWPVTISQVSEMAYEELFSRLNPLFEKYKDKLPREYSWPKKRHLENLKNSNIFSYCKEIYFDNRELCDAERFINIALSQGRLQMLLKNTIDEIKPDIENFKRLVREDLKAERSMYVSYKLILGMK